MESLRLVDENAEVRTWLADLKTDAAGLADGEALLSSAERARSASIPRVEIRERYIVRRANLRRLLGELTGTPPAEVPLVADALGKPAMASSSLYFSVATRGPWAVYAVTDRGPIGVDLESSANPFDFRPLMADHFSLEEAQALLARNPDDQWPAFLQAWTRKEACAKAEGKGMGYDLNRFDVREAPSGYQLHDLRLPEPLLGATAWIRSAGL